MRDSVSKAWHHGLMLSFGLEEMILNVACSAFSTGLVQRSPQLITLPLREVVSRGRLRTEVVTDGSAGKASATALDCSDLLLRFFVSFIDTAQNAQIWVRLGAHNPSYSVSSQR